jgi:hypothetical protein
MISLQRNAVIQRGPRFFERDGELMFENVIDGSTRFGPRPATDEDRARYPGAYAQMGDDPQINPPLVTYVEPEGGRDPEPSRPHAERRARARSE